MQDLRQKLEDQGLVGVLTIRETGQKIPLRFARGETQKLCKLELGPTSVDVFLRLTPVLGAKPGEPNLTLTLASGPAPVIDVEDTVAVQTAQVAEAARLEAEAKALADEAAAAAAAATAAEVAEAARLTLNAQTTPPNEPTGTAPPVTDPPPAASGAASTSSAKGRR